MQQQQTTCGFCKQPTNDIQKHLKLCQIKKQGLKISFCNQCKTQFKYPKQYHHTVFFQRHNKGCRGRKLNVIEALNPSNIFTAAKKVPKPLKVQIPDLLNYHEPTFAERVLGKKDEFNKLLKTSRLQILKQAVEEAVKAFEIQLPEGPQVLKEVIDILVDTAVQEEQDSVELLQFCGSKADLQECINLAVEVHKEE